MSVLAALKLLDGTNLPKTDASTGTVQHVLTIFFTIIGALAFLMIAISALRYVLSQGDPARISSAKNGIIYSVIGLVVAASADVIVNFVIGRTP